MAGIPTPGPQISGKLMPFPYNPNTGERNDDFSMSVKIQSRTGWFDLEDGVNYAIHGDSFGSLQQTYRNQTVNNQWVEGTYTVSSVKENVQEPLVVWVKGDTMTEQKLYEAKLIAAVEQYSWMLMVRYEGYVEYWQCFPSDYSVERQREFLHAHLAVVRINANRLPTKIIADASADEY